MTAVARLGRSSTPFLTRGQASYLLRTAPAGFVGQTGHGVARPTARLLI